MALFDFGRQDGKLRRRPILSARVQVSLLLLLSYSTICPHAYGQLANPSQEPATKPISINDCGSDRRVLSTVPSAVSQVSRSIAPAEVQCYQFKLAAHQFIHIEVLQAGVDVVVQLLDAAGSQVGGEIDSPNGREGVEPVSEVAEAETSYVLAVKSQDSSAARNPTYTIKVTELRTASAEDHSYVKGERAYVQGRLDVNTAQLLASQGRNNEAQQKIVAGVKNLEEARGLLEKTNRPSVLVEVLNFLGGAYHMLGRGDDALALFSQLRDMARKIPAPPFEVSALTNMATIYAQRGEDEKADAAYKEAVEVKSIDPATLAAAWQTRGNWYAQKGDVLRALDSHEKAAELFQQAKNLNRAADLYAGIGVTYFNRGVPSVARDYYKKALVLGANDPSILAYAYYNLASALSELGDPQGAVDALLSARALYDEAGKDPNQDKDELARATAHVLKGLGLAYHDLGDDSTALEFYRQSLARSEPEGKVKFDDVVPYVYLYRGLSLYRLGRRQESEEATKRALELFRDAKDKRGQANALVNAGGSFYDAGDRGRALQFLEMAKPLQREAGDNYGLAYTLTNIGRIYLDNGSPTEALRVLEDALALRRKVGDRNGEIITLYNMALAEMRASSLPKAFADVDTARSILEDILSTVSSQEMRASYLAYVHKVYELYIDILMRQERQVEALEFADNARARVLREVLLAGSLDSSIGLKPQDAERKQKLTEELSALLGRKKLLRPEAMKSQQAQELEREIDVRTAELKKLDSDRLRGNPAFAPLINPPRLSLEQIKELLDQDTVLLEFALGDEASYLWLVTDNAKQGVRAVPLPGRKQVEQVARRAHELLSDKRIPPGGKAEMQNLLARLSDMLLSQVSKELREKRIVIVGDGVLQYTPFAALPDPSRPGRQPLIVDHEIVYIPSASALAALRAVVSSRVPAAQGLALFGDPVYELPGSRAPADSSAQKGEKRLEPLIFSKDELDAIEDAFVKSRPGKGIKRWTDYDATRENATSPELADYAIIHYSAHGVADDQRPEAGGIYFSRYDRAGREIPYFVSLLDVYKLKLSADLVVLSACETALGKDVRGEGLVGLTRGFMHAGAARVVSTLWSVNQFHTAQLMKNFYEETLTGRKPPAASLRTAQKRMLDQNLEPYLWAGYVLYGDWR